jgi:hypothetical protein
MDISGSFRFLVMTAALLMWIGAVATAGETVEADEVPTPPVDAGPPPAPADDALDEGEEAPVGEVDDAYED